MRTFILLLSLLQITFAARCYYGSRELIQGFLSKNDSFCVIRLRGGPGGVEVQTFGQVGNTPKGVTFRRRYGRPHCIYNRISANRYELMCYCNFDECNDEAGVARVVGRHFTYR